MSDSAYKQQVVECMVDIPDYTCTDDTLCNKERNLLGDKILLAPNCRIVVGTKEKIVSRETFERMHSYQ